DGQSVLDHGARDYRAAPGPSPGFSTRKGKPGNDGIKRHSPAKAGVQLGDGGCERRASYFGHPDWAPAFTGKYLCLRFS
ncbi:hypothetical protein, partial [Clostridium perfringens]